ncbi:MAG TPA: hypothetical protein VFQ57_05425 [Sphingomonas sp.]|nr:hypothetical protein [Sphingomonas sp.]
MKAIDHCQETGIFFRGTTGGRLGRAALAALAALALTSCGGGQRPLDDSEKIVQSVLALLASTGRPVCTDDHTDDEALAVFREMTRAPRPSRAQLHWSSPLPLRPDVRVTGRDLRRAELGNREIEIREPVARTDGMPGLTQLYLDGAARRLMRKVGAAEEALPIRRSWLPRGVTARWWPLNRIRRDCWPLFAISNPVRDRRIAFVSVRAEHWGTLYALEPSGKTWRVVAEWSRWLY